MVARALQARTAIKSAHVVASVRIDECLTDPTQYSRADERLEIWQSPAGHRLERAPRNGGPLDSTGIVRKSICRGCGPQGEYVTQHPPKGTTALYPREHEMGKTWDAQLIDPRVFGYSYGGVYGTHRIDHALNTPGIKYVSATEEMFKGQRAIRVEAVFPAHNNCRQTCWVLPDKGYNVVRIEAVTPNDPAGPNGPHPSVESELAQDPGSGVWFPRRSVRRTYHAGQLMHDELVEVTTAEFNRVPDSVFSMAALALPVGEPVFDNRSLRTRYWTGTKLSSKPPGQDAVVLADVEPTPVGDYSRSGRDRWLTVGLSGVLAVTGLFLLRRALFRRG